MESDPAYKSSPLAPWIGTHVEKFEAEPKRFERTGKPTPRLPHCQQTLIFDPVMPAPVPWSLAWCENGELSRQDQFDLLQTLVSSETLEVQHAMVMAVERLSLSELSLMSTGELTGLCA